MRKLVIAVAAVGAIAAHGSAQAQAQGDIWQWRGSVAAGRTIEIRNVSGKVSALPASGAQVEVVALKTPGRRSQGDVSIEVVEHDRGATICVVYGATRERGSDACGPNSSSNSNNDDTRVDFEVRVPRGVRFSGTSVSGDVEANGLNSHVRATSVSGDVRVRTSDVAEASTVSGSIDVTMGRSDWTGALQFNTVSGNVVIALPDPANFEVTASSVSGELTSDWPLLMSGQIGGRSVRGTVGAGGRRINVNSVSGDVELVRAR